MSYARVIPRDLFNEGNLLKCLGVLYLRLETANLPSVELEHDGEAFDIDFNDDDGSLCVANICLKLGGDRRFYMRRPLNSRAPYPLLLMAFEQEIPIFNDEGQLTEEFLHFCRSQDTPR